MMNKHENTLLKLFIYLIFKFQKVSIEKSKVFNNIPVQKYSSWDKNFHTITFK